MRTKTYDIIMKSKISYDLHRIADMEQYTVYLVFNEYMAQHKPCSD